MEPVTVTINDACKAIGLGRSKLYELIADNKLQAIKIGGRSLVTVASIKALVSGASEKEAA